MTEMDSQLAVRSELRAQALATRDKLDIELRHIWSTEIITQLRTYLEAKEARFLHCYLSFRSEVETREFIERTLAEGMRVVVPVIEEIEENEQRVERLAHTEIQGISGFVKGRFGIEEPAVRSPASLESLDAVIVPVVAFDRRGTRLGYGKGFYDAFLHELSGTVERIGLAFQMQESGFIPRLAHDEPLDTIITERELIHIAD